MKKLTLNAADGYILHALQGDPENEKRGTIVISPATGIKKEYYVNFAQYLVKRGYTVLLFDYRGIGESAPPDLKQSEIYLHEWGTLDMNAVVNYLAEECECRDIIWIGHSIGAQLVGFLEKQHHIKQIIAINAALGYWRYFPYPMKPVIWLLWFVLAPIMIRIYGYGTMKKIGWGEDLTKNALMEWRSWCINKDYFGGFIVKHLHTDRFYNFRAPITAIYFSDDYIANDKTASLMMRFFPNAPTRLLRIETANYTKLKVGHSGVFRKKFEASLWPVLVNHIGWR